MDQTSEMPSYWKEIPFQHEYENDSDPYSWRDAWAPTSLSEECAVPLKGVVFDGDSTITQAPEFVEGMLPATGVGFLGGQSGAGKTFVAIDLAVALCTKQEFLGRRVRERVGVVVIAAEGAGTIPVRLEVARRHREAPNRLPFATIADTVNLSDPKEVAAVTVRLLEIDRRFQDLHGCRLGIIIVDTIAAAFLQKDENDNAEGARIIRTLRMLSECCKALVLAVHHYGKAAETGLRGASSLRAGADAVISVLGDRNEILGTCKNRSVAVAKSRTGSEGPVSGFELQSINVGVNDYGEEYGSCAIVATDASTSRTRRPSQAVQLFHDAYCAADLDFGVSHGLNHNGPTVRAIKVDQLRAEYLRRKVTGETDREKQHSTAMQAFRRILAQLPGEYATEVSMGEEWIWRP